MILDSHLQDRKAILDFLRAELEGPNPIGRPIDCSGAIHFEKAEDAYGAFIQEHDGEEILQDLPLRRYGVGVLYPARDDQSMQVGDNEVQESDPTDAAGTNDAFQIAADRIANETLSQSEVDIVDDDSVSESILRHSNEMFQCCMGVSFLIRPDNGSKLLITFTGGVYEPKDIHIAEKTVVWWFRRPIKKSVILDIDNLPLGRRTTIKDVELVGNDVPETIQLTVEGISRPHRFPNGTIDPGAHLITVYVVNKTIGSSDVNSRAIFQTRLSIQPHDKAGLSPIVPYPERKVLSDDHEDSTFSLIYRKQAAFAVGHGCSPDWTTSNEMRATQIRVECIPAFEIPAITSNAIDHSGHLLTASMSRLAGLDEKGKEFVEVECIIKNYSDWIERKSTESRVLGIELQPTAIRHIEQCRLWVSRMEEGLAFISSDSTAREAFFLANHAMLLQQIQSATPTRITSFDHIAQRLIVDGDCKSPNTTQPPSGRGHWRAFQIAFLLSNVRSIAISTDRNRKTVDLVWFPTGGGKTEAYLAALAFGVFYRRLTNCEDTGVHAIMRYTLRLLTTQQFQRASTLICAMETLRRKNTSILGEAPFRIGLWLGGDTTPNTRSNAVEALRNLTSGKSTENPFLLLKCPWCGAKLGQVQTIHNTGKDKKKNPRRGPSEQIIAGYVRTGDTVSFQCPDERCSFHKGIPAIVIDEDLYAMRPDVIIATVDKFAVLPWRPEARTLFGIEMNGGRRTSPPGLIIQDELHLITGALGTLTGLFESLVEELCTDQRTGQTWHPKIICSTATIKNYRDQIRGLFARNDVMLFPPPGLEIGDSFFARYDLDGSGKTKPGRMYVGVHAPALRSMQTAQVRTITALLQAPMTLPENARNPWWTLVSFFNSLRELGTTLTLFQSDIPDYRRALQKRLGIDKSKLRRLVKPLELTSRLKSDEVPGVIAALETPYQSTAAVDVCLASSMIEVGIDIDRLSLMLVNGQPKSTAQYIQVTGRIGRSIPGLVITLYNYSRPRDRSHYERFRSYHERFYSDVEPSSVTPFSSPSLHRFLHTIMLGFVRQTLNESAVASPDPCPASALDRLKERLFTRAEIAANDEERSILDHVFRQRLLEWRTWKPVTWTGKNNPGNIPLMYPAGEHVLPEWADHTWPVPMSLRNVDATCQIELSGLYEQEDE